jgi:hypothetical protein
VSKPVRVMEGEVAVARCPLCTKPIVATVEIEVRLGELEISETVVEETGEVEVNVEARPRMRRLRIEHECKAPPLVDRVAREPAELAGPEGSGDGE